MSRKKRGALRVARLSVRIYRSIPGRAWHVRRDGLRDGLMACYSRQEARELRAVMVRHLARAIQRGGRTHEK